ncbi:23659_t:CDS:2, partial [Gigaspora rosea]
KMNKWYYKLVSEKYRTYIQQTIIRRDNKSIIVCEILHELEVLDLHKVLTPVITQVNNDNPNANELAGYYAFQPSKKDEIIWYFYMKDETFKLLKNSRQDNICFKTKNSLTLVKYQLQTVIEMEETPIRKGIMLNKSGKYLLPQETQALIVEYNTIKNELKNAKKTITQLKDKITKLTNLPDQDIDLSQDEILHTTINDLIEK